MYTYLMAYFWKILFLVLPSRQSSLIRSMSCCPSLRSESAFSRNSLMILNGGFVMMSPFP